MTHIPASVHDRLLNKSRETNTPFNEILQYYGIERFYIDSQKQIMLNISFLKVVSHFTV